MKHYSKEDLELYRNGKMSVLGRLNCAHHLKECEQCNKILQELQEDDNFLTELRSSIQIFDDLSTTTTISSLTNI